MVQPKGNLIPGTHATGWILLDEDYTMRSLIEQATITSVFASGNLSGVCTREHYIVLYEFLNEIYNINSIYMMNLE